MSMKVLEPGRVAIVNKRAKDACLRSNLTWPDKYDALIGTLVLVEAATEVDTVYRVSSNLGPVMMDADGLSSNDDLVVAIQKEQGTWLFQAVSRLVMKLVCWHPDLAPMVVNMLVEMLPSLSSAMPSLLLGLLVRSNAASLLAIIPHLQPLHSRFLKVHIVLYS